MCNEETERLKIRVQHLRSQSYAALRSHRRDIQMIAANGITPGESIEEAMRYFDLAQMMACVIEAGFCEADAKIQELEL